MTAAGGSKNSSPRPPTSASTSSSRARCAALRCSRPRGTCCAAGYSVEAHALAVNERSSWLGVHDRFEKMLAQGGAARFTAREAHDVGAAGMLETLRQIEHERLADRVLITTRSRQVLYDNSFEAGVWRQPARASEIVENERTRPRTSQEVDSHREAWRRVLESMKRRQAPADGIRAAAAQAAADLGYFRATRFVDPGGSAGQGRVGNRDPSDDPPDGRPRGVLARTLAAIQRAKTMQSPSAPPSAPTPIADRLQRIKGPREETRLSPAPDPAVDNKADIIRPDRTSNDSSP